MGQRSQLDKPDVVDLVSLNAAGDEVAVVIVATAPWDPSGADMPRLQAKLKTAVAFVADGQLDREYPDARGRLRRIHIRTNHPLGAPELQLVDAAREHWCEPEGIKLSWSDGVPT